MTLAAPFPYFGGKSGVAPEVWSRFGDVANYIEPFAGSLAVLLARPTLPAIETVNDLDGFLVNFWRAVSVDPEAVAHYADWPVAEADLHARHAYLVDRIPWLTERLCGDPAFHEPRLAGWWVWGACAAIGDGWCSGQGPWRARGGVLIRSVDAEGAGQHRKLPHLGDAGRGINRQIPHLGDAGCGVGDPGRHRALSEQGRAILAWMLNLQARLRRVRICCGDWARVVTPVVTVRHGLTGVFLDPPYSEGAMRYAAGSGNLREEVQAWCSENGEEPLLRIALCGHEGEYDLPGWAQHTWKARGGYGNQGGEDSEDNRHRETVWFSPHCLSASQPGLFDR